MSTRWVARMVALIVLLLFFLLMTDLQRRLVRMQRMQKPAPTSTH